MASFMYPLTCQGVLRLFLSHELAQAPSPRAFSEYLFIYFMVPESMQHRVG